MNLRVLFTLDLLVVAPERAVIIKTIVRVKVQDAGGERCIGVLTLKDTISTDQVLQSCLAAVEDSLRHPFAPRKALSLTTRSKYIQ